MAKKTELIPEAKAIETAHFVRIKKTIKDKFDSEAIFSTHSKKEITEILFQAFIDKGDKLLKSLSSKPF